MTEGIGMFREDEKYDEPILALRLADRWDGQD